VGIMDGGVSLNPNLEYEVNSVCYWSVDN
jgi:hypothetical protein